MTAVVLTDWSQEVTESGDRKDKRLTVVKQSRETKVTGIREEDSNSFYRTELIG